MIGVWIFGYGLGRLWIELLRVDSASLIAGVRVNVWISLIAIASGLYVAISGRQKSIDSINS